MLSQSSSACTWGICKVSSRSWLEINVIRDACSTTDITDCYRGLNAQSICVAIKLFIFQKCLLILSHLQVSQIRWPFLHWKILVGGAISSKHTCYKNTNILKITIPLFHSHLQIHPSSTHYWLYPGLVCIEFRHII